MKKHFTVPFFIPHEGCPFICVFCGQKKISGRGHSVSVSEISRTIKEYLKTIPKDSTREVAFFGGSFTGLPINRQTELLKAVQPFIKRGSIHAVRLSTRPDYVDQPTLGILKKYDVSSIELGAQSISDDVLRASKRGHTAEDVKRASRLIVKNGFILGHQIMVGLPGSTLAREIKTARSAIALGASEVRIYPVVVIRGTELAAMWKKGLFKPLTESEAIARCARLIEIFKRNRIRVLRCGLHPSDGLLTGKDLLAGPFHQAFGQKVETHMYGRILKNFLKKKKNISSMWNILSNPRDAASVIGYKRENAEYVESIVNRRGLFKVSDKIKDESVAVLYKDGAIKTIGKL